MFIYIKLNPQMEWTKLMKKFAKSINITYYHNNLPKLQNCIWKLDNNKLIIKGDLSAFSLSKVYYCLDANTYLDWIKLDTYDIKVFCATYDIDVQFFLNYLKDNDCIIKYYTESDDIINLSKLLT